MQRQTITADCVSVRSRRRRKIRSILSGVNLLFPSIMLHLLPLRAALRLLIILVAVGVALMFGAGAAGYFALPNPRAPGLSAQGMG